MPLIYSGKDLDVASEFEFAPLKHNLADLTASFEGLN
jgi:hypothetical protein